MTTAVESATVIVVVVVVVIVIEAAARNRILSHLVVSLCDYDNGNGRGQTPAKLDSFAQHSAPQDIW